MRPLRAWGVLLAMAAATLAALQPWSWWPAVPLALLALAVARRRVRTVGMLASPIAFYAIVSALVTRDHAVGAVAGAQGGLRLGAALALNVAGLERVGTERLLDGLRLPHRATAWMAAVLVAAHDVARDAGALVDARRLEGESGWPKRVLGRARAMAQVLPALVARSVRRAETRREALRLAGQRMGPRFVPIVAIASLVVADRLLLAALPNVKLTYTLVFAGGVLYGPWTGFLAGLAGMMGSDFLLSGLYAPPYVQALAVAWLGLLGGLLRPWAKRFGSAAWSAGLAAFGVASTFVFSALSDLSGLVVAPELWRPGIVRVTLLAGLAFNIVPALANGALFGLAVWPIVEARPTPLAAPRPTPDDPGSAA